MPKNERGFQKDSKKVQMKKSETKIKLQKRFSDLVKALANSNIS